MSELYREYITDEQWTESHRKAGFSQEYLDLHPRVEPSKPHWKNVDDYDYQGFAYFWQDVGKNGQGFITCTHDDDRPDEICPLQDEQDEAICPVCEKHYRVVVEVLEG